MRKNASGGVGAFRAPFSRKNVMAESIMQQSIAKDCCQNLFNQFLLCHLFCGKCLLRVVLDSSKRQFEENFFIRESIMHVLIGKI